MPKFLHLFVVNGIAVVWKDLKWLKKRQEIPQILNSSTHILKKEKYLCCFTFMMPLTIGTSPKRSVETRFKKLGPTNKNILAIYRWKVVISCQFNNGWQVLNKILQARKVKILWLGILEKYIIKLLKGDLKKEENELLA